MYLFVGHDVNHVVNQLGIDEIKLNLIKFT